MYFMYWIQIGFDTECNVMKWIDAKKQNPLKPNGIYLLSIEGYYHIARWIWHDYGFQVLDWDIPNHWKRPDFWCKIEEPVKNEME